MPPSISSSIVADPVWKLENSSCTICDTSLMQNPHSQALVSPSSGCLALLVLKKKTLIRDVQFLELHTCFLIGVSSGFGWWSLLLKYWEGVSSHIRCIAKQPGKSLEMILSPANHNEQFKSCRSACFACSEAFVADFCCGQKFWFPETCSKQCWIFSSAQYNYILRCVVMKKKVEKVQKWNFKLAFRLGKIWKIITARYGRHRFLRFQGT